MSCSIRNILTSLAFLYFSVAVHAQSKTAGSAKEVRGSGIIVQEQRTLNPFSFLHIDYVSGDISVEVGGNASGLNAQLDDNLKPLLHVEAVGDTLKISLRDPQGSPVWTGDATIKLAIKTSSLNGVVYKANGTLTVHGLKGDSFSLTNQGNGRVTLQGETGNLQLVNAANGYIAAEKLMAQQANVVAQANGTVRVKTGRLNSVNAGRGSIINVAEKP